MERAGAFLGNLLLENLSHLQHPKNNYELLRVLHLILQLVLATMI